MLKINRSLTCNIKIQYLGTQILKIIMQHVKIVILKFSIQFTEF